VNDQETAAQLLGPHLMPGSGGPAALVKVADEVRAKIGDAKLMDAKLGDAKFGSAKRF
jgi:hypothetical protein